MALTVETSTFANAARHSFMASTTQSMADTLPSVNFGFDDLRERMAKFTVKFDQFIADGRKRVLEERNQFRYQMAELQEDHKMKQRGIEILSQKSQSHAQTMAKEVAETEDMEAAIASIASQRDERSMQRDRLKDEITATNRVIGQRLEAQRKYSANVNAQAKLNDPELDFWIDYLCLRIEGTKTDQLRFIFTHIDERAWDKEFWFEMALDKPDYEVKACKPQLDQERVGLCLDRFNESRDVGGFLKDIRELFVHTGK